MTAAVRSATNEDAAAIASLAGQLGYPATAAEMQPRLEAALANTLDAILVAVLDDVVIAWIQLSEVASLESGAFAEIRGLIVDERHRSAGVGALLVQAGEEWTAARGLSRLRVRSNVTRERTHAFYERLGFRVRKSQKVFEKQTRP